jgi:hypothetical protein
LTCIVLANSDYTPSSAGAGHMTDEGHQLQAGLNAAGWPLVGHGFGDDLADVPQVLERYNPDAVFVQDPRDWDRHHGGCFNPAVTFANVEALKSRPDLFRATVCKDAGSSVEYQHDFADRIGADAIVIYYHEQSVTRVAPWLAGRTLIRTYHSVDSAFIRTLDLTAPRKRAIVTGAVSSVYPLRARVFGSFVSLGIHAVTHPGYGNSGTRTPDYLRMLAGYRVHVATASAYRFALRKIIESVAVGCTPVTNLPAYDVLPEIDGALVRVSEDASLKEMAAAIAAADARWNLDERMHYAAKAQAFYDYLAIGARLSANLTQAAEQKRAVLC